MLIICCGMPRSGSTWQYQITSELVEKFGSGRRIGFLPAEAFLESTYVNTPANELLVLKCHQYHPYYGQLCEGGLAKAIYGFRDIREVVLSIAWKLGKSIPETIRSDALQQAIDSYYRWTTTPNTMIQRYEVFTSQPEKAILEISTHIGLTISENDASQVSLKYSKGANQNFVDEFKDSLQTQGIELKKNQVMYDQHSLLHWDHIRPETALKWQDLGPEILKELSLVVQQWLIDAGLEKDNNWSISSLSSKE